MMYVVYDTTTGRIVATGSALRQEDAQIQAGGGRSVLCNVEADEDLHCVDVSADPACLDLRPVMPEFSKTTIRADGTDKAVLGLGLVQIERLLISGVAQAVTGSVVSLTADVPATYDVTVKAYPYRDQTVQITAVAP